MATETYIMLGILVVGGYIAIQYGPQIVNALQQGNQQSADQSGANMMPAVDNTPDNAPAKAKPKAKASPRHKPARQSHVSAADLAAGVHGALPNSIDQAGHGPLAHVGYWDGYNVPDMGPQWEKSVNAKTYLANVGEASFTQIVKDPRTGRSYTQTTIDPYFPAGFYNSQANYNSSLNDPAIRGGI